MKHVDPGTYIRKTYGLAQCSWTCQSVVQCVPRYLECPMLSTSHTTSVSSTWSCRPFLLHSPSYSTKWHLRKVLFMTLAWYSIYTYIVYIAVNSFTRRGDRCRNRNTIQWCLMGWSCPSRSIALCHYKKHKMCIWTFLFIHFHVSVSKSDEAYS